MPESQLVGASARTFRVEVAARSDENAAGRALVEAARHLGITGLTACAVDRLYFLYGQLTRDDIAYLGRELLADAITETFTLATHSPLAPAPKQGADKQIVEVTLLPGVTDPAAENLLRAAHLLGLSGLERAATGQRYRLQGALAETDLRRLAAEVLANPVVQR
ncbi:MAG TPA: phosphoribosylformylglycinamidine synthase subunit PurS, partial [Roseiflexaceae bacterium]